MGSKIINFKDLKVEHPNRYKVTDSNGSEDIKKIDFDPGLIYQQGTPESAENFNNIQKNCIYEVNGIRILEGQEEIYDISIDGFDNFEFENLKILMTPNATNTIKGSFVRLNGAKYIIRNRADSIGVGQIFSGEKVFLSLDFSLKVANVTGVLNGGSVRTLKEVDDSKVNKDGDVMSGRIRFNTNITTGISFDRTAFEFHSNNFGGTDPSIGFVKDGSWRFRVNGVGDGFFTGQATASKFIGPLQGNSDTASKLQTSRNITIGDARKAFDGGADATYSLSEIGAINKTGDTMTGALKTKVIEIEGDNRLYFGAGKTKGHLMQNTYVDNDQNKPNFKIIRHQSGSGVAQLLTIDENDRFVLDMSSDFNKGVTFNDRTALKYGNSHAVAHLSGNGVNDKAQGNGIRGGYDTASLDYTANLDLYSWHGISFSTSNGTETKPSFVFNTRNGMAYFKGGLHTSAILSESSEGAIQMRSPTAGANGYIIARDSDNSNQWMLGRATSGNFDCQLHNYKKNTTLALSDYVEVNKPIISKGHTSLLRHSDTGFEVHCNGGYFGFVKSGSWHARTSESGDFYVKKDLQIDGDTLYLKGNRMGVAHGFTGATRTTYTFGSQILGVSAIHTGGSYQTLRANVSGNTFTIYDNYSASISLTIIVNYLP